MTRRAFPAGNVHNDPGIDFFVMPRRIADEYWARLEGFENVLLDYYVEAADSVWNVSRTPIQHVWFGEGGGSAGFVMDGELDAAAAPVATEGAFTLWAALEGGVLYVAAPSVSATAGADHFILVSSGFPPGGAGAPWAKAGTVASRRFFLAQEDANFWRGWFDSLETVRSDAPFASAAGTVLEGTIDLAALAGSAPGAVRLALATYASPDGGALASQAPAGDGDGHVEAAEYVLLSTTVAAGEPAASAAPAALKAIPNPGLGEVRFEARGAAAHEPLLIFDVRGRLVRRLEAGARAWDGRDDAGAPAASGVYLVSPAAGGVAVRVALVR